MSEEMKEREEQKTIILPKELQIEMMKFFLRTSIPRKKREKNNSNLSVKKDRSDKEWKQQSTQG